MAKIGLLRSLADGLLGAFVSRNNDVGRKWALGLLYTDANPDSRIVKLNLLERSATPATPTTTLVAQNYGEFLRCTLIKHGVDWDALDRAEIEIHFNTKPVLRAMDYHSNGDPFECIATIRSKRAQVVTKIAFGRCRPTMPQERKGE